MADRINEQNSLSPKSLLFAALLALYVFFVLFISTLNFIDLFFTRLFYAGFLALCIAGVSLFSWWMLNSKNNKFAQAGPYILSILWLAVWVVFLLFSKDKIFVLKLLSFLLWFFVSSVGVNWMAGRCLEINPPFFIGPLLWFVFCEMVLLVFGMFGLAQPWLHALLALVPLFLFIMGWKRNASNFIRGIHNFIVGLRVSGWIWLYGFLILICFTQLNVAVPETVTDASQLHTPKVMSISSGGGIQAVSELPFSPYSFFPSFAHILYSFGYSIWGPLGIKFICFSFLFILFSAFSCLALSLGLRRSFFLASFVVFGFFPGLIWLIGIGYLDFPTTVIGFAAVAAFVLVLGKGKVDVESGKNPVKVFCFISGLLFGAAVNCKLNMVLYSFAFIGGFWVLGFVVPMWRQMLSLKMFWHGLGGVFMICLPHFLAMFVLTDNPVYPALNEIFNSPLWDNRFPVTQHHFHDFQFSEIFLLPFNLTFHPEWYGENAPGAMGIWFLYLFPALFLLWFKRFDLKTMGLLVLAVIYILLLYKMRSNYLRYYWPTIGIWVLLAALGIQTLIDRISILKKEVPTGWFAFFPALFLFFTVSQLFASAVPGPSREHLKYYLKKHIRWESRYYPVNMVRYLDFVERLPPETRMFVHGTELVSSIPRKTFANDTATLSYSGVKNYSPGGIEKLRNPVALWLQKNIFGFAEYKTRLKNPFPFDAEKAPVEGRILEYGDVFTVFNTHSYNFMLERNRFMTADRLLYSSSDEKGAQSRFIASFRINDQLLGKPDGIHLAYKENVSFVPYLEGEKISWFQTNASGERKPVANLSEIEIENQSPLLAEMPIPENSKVFKTVLNIKYIGEPDPSVGLSILYRDEASQIIKKTNPGVFSYNSRDEVSQIIKSDNSLAAYLVIDPVPEGAQSLTILISPNVNKKVGIQSYSLFFEKA